ncbi:peptidylprolyl isomerase, partial [Candidatus Woesearchaeota archaeon CG_4_10_14_0_8_um_filter_47_5]
AKESFYNGVIIHQVIKGSVVVTGDPTGTGKGGPGYTIEDELSPELRHDSVGTLSMSNRGPNTAGSIFFITLAPRPAFDDRYTVFGKLTEGQDVLQKIGNVTVDPSTKRPVQEIKVTSITIE